MTMMTPPDREVTCGVDTHGDVHVVAVLDSALGRLLGTASLTPPRTDIRRCWRGSRVTAG